MHAHNRTRYVFERTWTEIELFLIERHVVTLQMLNTIDTLYLYT